MSPTWVLPYLPLLPAAIPLAGAGLLMMLGSLVTPRRSTMAVAVTATAAFVANLYWAKPPWTLSVPAIPVESSSLVFVEGLAFTLNQWTRIGGLLLAGVVALTTLVSLQQPMSRGAAALCLLMLASGQCFILSSNVFSLLICWGMMDLALLGLSSFHAIDLEDTDRATRGVGLLQIAGLAILAAALFLEQAHSLSVASQVLMIIAAWIRLGAYPVQTRSLRHESVPMSEMIVAHGVPFVAGLYLLVGVVEQGVPHQGVFASVSAAACFLTSFLAFQARSLRPCLFYVTLNSASVAVLLLFTMGSAGAAAAWVTVAGVLLAISCLGQKGWPIPPSLGRWGRIPSLIASLSLIGLPLTGGFVSKWSALRATTAMGHIGPALALSLCGVLVATPLMNRSHKVWIVAGDTIDTRPTAWIVLGTTILLAVALVGLRFMVPVLQSARGEVSASLMSSGPSMLLTFLLGFLVPVAGGFFLIRLDSYMSKPAHQATSTIAAVVNLDWALYALQRLWRGIAIPLRYVGHLIEERVYVGWVLFWVLVVLLWLQGW